jgi:endonuclease/exonuclease/phosphatase (EEP) superfamily protein YafD
VLRRLRAAGLVEAHGRGRRGASAGRWRGTTWPRTGALRWAPGIRLDHVLHAPALVCDYAAVCADVGSDHAPIVARFKWASD